MLDPRSHDELIELLVYDCKVHSDLALKYLGYKIYREAAQKAFNAWRAALAAIYLKCTKEVEEEVLEALLLAVPSRLLALSAALENECAEGVLAAMARAAKLYDYYLHGANAKLAPIRSDEEAIKEIKELLKDIATIFREIGIKGYEEAS